jgi:hypothetical protein
MTTDPPSDPQTRFIVAGARFFEFNGNKNTPNIIEHLTEAIKESSASSAKLAATLNRLTLWYAVITGIGVIVAIIALVLQVAARAG